MVIMVFTFHPFLNSRAVPTRPRAPWVAMRTAKAWSTREEP